MPQRVCAWSRSLDEITGLPSGPIERRFRMDTLHKAHEFLTTYTWFLTACGLAVTLILTAIAGARYYLKTHDIQKRYDEEREARIREESNRKALEHELAEAKKTGTCRSWLFLVHDATPRNPLCPSCYADAKVVRMHLHNTGTLIGKKMIVAFSCLRCDRTYHVDPAIEDELAATLGYGELVASLEW